MHGHKKETYAELRGRIRNAAEETDLISTLRMQQRMCPADVLRVAKEMLEVLREELVASSGIERDIEVVECENTTRNLVAIDLPPDARFQVFAPPEGIENNTALCYINYGHKSNLEIHPPHHANGTYKDKAYCAADEIEDRLIAFLTWYRERPWSVPD